MQRHMPSHHEKEAATPPTGHVVMEKRDEGEKLGLPPTCSVHTGNPQEQVAVSYRLNSPMGQ